MIRNFSACWAFTAQQEGGYTSNPADPGNWTGGACGIGVCAGTAFGISAAAYPQIDIKDLTQAQAGIMMKADYWDKVNGDELPIGIDLVVFDFAVNAGPSASAMQLQGLLKVEQKGGIGPVTLAALARHDPAWVIAALTLSHQAYYRRLPGYGEFGNGWIARTVRCQAAAGSMLREAAAMRG
jgi:lysozyme family protein